MNPPSYLSFLPGDEAIVAQTETVTAHPFLDARIKVLAEEGVWHTWSLDFDTCTESYPETPSAFLTFGCSGPAIDIPSYTTYIARRQPSACTSPAPSGPLAQGIRYHLKRTRRHHLALRNGFPGKLASYSHSRAEATATPQNRCRASRGLHVAPEGLTEGYAAAATSAYPSTTYIQEEHDDKSGQDVEGYRGSHTHMSLDRSPSPHRSGGWSSPGLTSPFEETNGHSRSQNPSPGKRNGYGQLNGGAQPGVTWGSAKAKSARVNGYPSYQPQNQGFFGRHYRRLSESLPHFARGGQEDRYAEKEKLGRGRSGGWSGSSNSKMKWRELPRRVGLLISRRRKGVALVLLFLLGLMIWFQKRTTPPVLAFSRRTNIASTALQYLYRRTSFLGGGSKFVIILAANQGGGVMEWKGPREWAIERDSVKNKKKYVADWGYELDIVDMSTKKRYAHEWRESWEKVDVIRKAMTKYPDAEW